MRLPMQGKAQLLRLSSPSTVDLAPRAPGIVFMSRFFKSAAFPILIVVVLAFFAQRLINPSTQGPTYDVLDVPDRTCRDGNVKSAVIKTKDNTSSSR